MEKQIQTETVKAALSMTVTAIRLLRTSRDIEQLKGEADPLHFSHDVEEDMTRCAERIAEEIVMMTEDVTEEDEDRIFETARRNVQDLLAM